MATQVPFSYGDARMEFICLAGIVQSTDQRSDSYTSGSSRVVVLDGSGGGRGSVSTEVIVSRDIWVQDDQGKEHHVRIQKDVPVRVGQRIAFIYCKCSNDKLKRQFNGLVSVYVVPVNRSYEVHGLVFLASLLSFPVWTEMTTFLMVAKWLAALASCTILIGIPIFFILVSLTIITKRRRLAMKADVLGLLERHHQGILDNLFQEDQCQKVITPVVIAAEILHEA